MELEYLLKCLSKIYEKKLLNNARCKFFLKKPDQNNETMNFEKLCKKGKCLEFSIIHH